MFNAKSLLDSLTGSLTGNLTGGQGLQGLAEKAKSGWQGQSSLGKGAVAGGLLGILMTKGGRRMLGTGAKIGGAALIGGLAYQAYTNWKSGGAAQPEAAAVPAQLPSPEGTAFLPSDPAAANDLSERLLRAMVSAAKADGHVTPDERARIDGALAQLDLGPEAQALIAAELDAPLDLRRIAALARTEEEAAEIYTATLLVIDEQSLEEKGYLAMLAAAMNLDEGLVRHLNAQVNAQATPVG